MTVKELRLALEMFPDELPVSVVRPEPDGLLSSTLLDVTATSVEGDTEPYVRLYLEDEAVVL